MPILDSKPPNPPVYYPTENYQIVRYMDITKFISILQRRALFFCRLDKLEDKFEGTTAALNYQRRIDLRKKRRDVGNPTQTDEEIFQMVKDIYEFEIKQKAVQTINCWNIFDSESAALWKIYSNFSKGILIKSTISNLINSFSNNKKNIYLSKIEYLDYSKEVMPDENFFLSLVHKQKAYSYEQEIRLIYSVSIDDSVWSHDWESEETQEGVYLNSDIDILIDEIIVGPYSPKWYLNLLEDLLLKYGLKKTIKPSVLTPRVS